MLQDHRVFTVHRDDRVVYIVLVMRRVFTVISSLHKCLQYSETVTLVSRLVGDSQAGKVESRPAISVSWSVTGMVGLAPKWVRLDPKLD